MQRIEKAYNIRGTISVAALSQDRPRAAGGWLAMARDSLDSRSSIYQAKLRSIGRYLEHIVEYRFLVAEHGRFHIVHFGKLLVQNRKQVDSCRDSNDDFSGHGGSIELIPGSSCLSSDQCCIRAPLTISIASSVRQHEVRCDEQPQDKIQRLSL